MDRRNALSMNSIRRRVSLFLIGIMAFAAIAAVRNFGPSSVYFSIFHAFGVQAGWVGYEPYFDLDAVLSALQCHNAGFPVFQQNPCDLSQRVLAYSPAWLVFARIGFSSSDLVWMGAIAVVAYIATVALIANPTNKGETWIFLLSLFSSDSLYALERLNVDVLLFILIIPTAFIFGASAKSRTIAYLAILIGGFLKIYPIAGFALALTEKTGRLIAVALAACAATTIFVAVDWSSLREMLPNIPYAYPLNGAFGSGNIFLMVGNRLIRGFPDQAGRIPAVIVVLRLVFDLGAMVASFAFARKLIAVGVEPPALSRPTVLYIIAASIVAFAFFVGQNANYRGIWLIPLLPWLVDLGRKTANPLARRLSAVGVWLTLAMLWFEALHLGLIRVFGQTAGDVIAFWIREPLWWFYIIAMMTGLWIQLGDIPALRRFNIASNRTA